MYGFERAANKLFNKFKIFLLKMFFSFLIICIKLNVNFQCRKVSKLNIHLSSVAYCYNSILIKYISYHGKNFALYKNKSNF